jgi:hypothetical protein
MNVQTTNTFNQRAQTALEFAGKQLRHLITQYPDYLPLYTVPRPLVNPQRPPVIESTLLFHRLEEKETPISDPHFCF